MNIKELSSFFKTCRKHGITEISWNESGVTAKFGEIPKKQTSSYNDSDEDEIESDTPTDDEMAFYHVAAVK